MLFIKYILLASALTLAESILSIDRFNEESLACSINWLHFHVNENCIKIIGKSMPTCIYQELSRQNIRIVNYDSLSKISPLIAANRSDCEMFLHTANDLDELRAVFNRNVKYFYTFTKIFIIHLFNGSEQMIFNQNQTEYIYRNALKVYIIGAQQSELSDTRRIVFKSIQNTLTGKTLDLNASNSENVANFYGLNTQHPFLDRNDKSKEFTVSFHNCSPYIIYFKNETGVKRSKNRKTFDKLLVMIKDTYLFSVWTELIIELCTKSQRIGE